MAAILALAAKPSPLPRSYLPPPKNHLRRIRCSSGAEGGGGGGAPPFVRAAVRAVTELLRLLSPKKSREATQGDDLAGAAPVSPRSMEDIVAVLEADYARAYFLTGNFTLDIYAEDCLFEDPTIKFRGRDRYSQNLDLLVPFFDSPCLELEDIKKGLRVETRFISATWKLRTYLKLPWRPLIAIKGETTYDLDRDFRVIRHAESWNVSALEAIGQILLSAQESDS